MKVFKLILPLVLGAALLVSCGLIDGPRQTAEQFLTKLNAMDFEGAAKFATFDSQAILSLGKGMTAGLDPAALEKAKARTVKIVSVTENGDSAVVVYQLSDSDKPQNLAVKKVDGKWLADFKKDMGTMLF